MQAQMFITIAQKSTNKAQSEGVGCGGAFNLGRASFLEVICLFFRICGRLQDHVKLQ